MKSGDAYCMAFTQYCASQVVQKQVGVNKVIVNTGNAQEAWRSASPIQKTQAPAPGLIAIWAHGGGRDRTKGHAGIVTGVNKDGSFETIEGNTAKGNGNEGVGRKHRRADGQENDGEMVLLGFINPFNTKHDGTFSFTDSVSSLIKDAAAKTKNVDERDLRAIIHIESGGQSGLVSKTNVRGIAQITERTWNDFWQGKKAYSTNDKDQIETVAGIYSRSLQKFSSYADAPRLAAIAYNVGDGVVSQALEIEKKNRITFDEALGQSVRKNIRKIFTNQKTIDRLGGLEAATQNKISEAINYGRKFDSAQKGVDFYGGRAASAQRAFDQAAVAANNPKGDDKKDGDNAITSFFNQFGRLNALDGLNNEVVAKNMADWWKATVAKKGA